MNLILVIVCIVFVHTVAAAFGPFQNVTEMIAAAGYPFENHQVTTQDGYILQVQRIPYGKTSPPSSTKRPILLQHGLLDTASTWIISGPGRALGFYLADNGFDVWLGNSRGNRYCQSHVSLNNDSQQFWQFSWDDMAKYDLPAKINYILQATGAPWVLYVGHSEGTEIAFAEFSSASSTVASKVKLFVALAPIIYLNHVSVPLFVSLDRVPFADYVRLVGDESFLSSPEDVVKLLPYICSTIPNGCEKAICYLSGCENVRNVNSSELGLYFSHFPAGTSMQNMLHYWEGLHTTVFQMLDYGTPQLNMQHYNSTTPPLYTPQNLLPPTVVFTGGYDTMADSLDVTRLLQTIPKPLQFINVTSYGHGDFVWGDDALEKVYEPMLQLLNQYAPPW